ncbi:hypothetical protein [Streptomyces sp. NPDC048385]|uniref:hypothetical protein n=1 Tax=unclassified Streptomyces TaxID=2593676 RepID=UPI0034192A05
MDREGGLGNGDAAFRAAGLPKGRGDEKQAMGWCREAAERGRYHAHKLLAEHAPDTVEE